jgi:squalene synthase HpnC
VLSSQVKPSYNGPLPFDPTRRDSMKVDHYENFPVGSVLLPARLRPAVGVIYHFARGADDIADEGDASPKARHEGLATYRRGLDAIVAGQSPNPSGALFDSLAKVVSKHQLPIEPFYALLSAFDQDVDIKRYADFTALRDYTRRSADPVGQIMLHLFKAATVANVRDSDRICTSLQLINFWQDVAVDWDKDRIYLPREDMARYKVSEASIAAGLCDDPWRALMNQQISRARSMMADGSGLALRMPGRFGWELRLVVQGGLRILERIELSGYDVFRHRPTLSKVDWLVVAWRALRMRSRVPRASA